MKSRRGVQFFIALRFAGLSLALCSSLSFSQDEHGVPPRIISPKDGTIVRPGQSMTVKVERGSERGVLLIAGDDPLNPCAAAKISHECSIRIPRDIDPGRYDLWTSAVTKDGGSGLTSESITIDVERADKPLSITTSLGSPTQPIHLWKSEGGLEIRIVGHYADGTVVSLDRSTMITVVSQNSTIVRAEGRFLIPVADGSTNLTIDGDFRIPVTVQSFQD